MDERDECGAELAVGQRCDRDVQLSAGRVVERLREVENACGDPQNVVDVVEIVTTG